MKKREYYLDLARCTAILLVIGLHVIAPHITTPAYYGTRMWPGWSPTRRSGRGSRCSL